MYSLALPLAFTTLLGLATADFWIYSETNLSGLGDAGIDSAGGWKVYASPPSCSDVCNSIFVHETRDASHSGLRVKGKPDLNGDGGPITELEYNGGKGSDVHWTIYRSSEYVLVPADGGPPEGRCVVDQEDDYENCSCGIGNAVNGQSQFRCTSKFDVAALMD